MQTATNPTTTRLPAEVLRNSKSPGTWKNYASAFARFREWCEQLGHPHDPTTADAICEYLLEMKDTYKYATLKQHLAAIRQRHKQNGYGAITSDPAINETMKAIARMTTTEQTRKTAIRLPQLWDMIEGEECIENKALLSVGFFSAMRRSELTAMTWRDIRFEEGGCVIRIPRSKTDQTGSGREIGLPVIQREQCCPVRLLIALKEARRRSTEARVFPRHTNTVANRVKAACVRVGLDPALYAAHSLRAGFCTEAARSGVSALQIAKQTGHRTSEMVERYVREGQVLTNNPINGMVTT